MVKKKITNICITICLVNFDETKLKNEGEKNG